MLKQNIAIMMAILKKESVMCLIHTACLKDALNMFGFRSAAVTFTSMKIKEKILNVT